MIFDTETNGLPRAYSQNPYMRSNNWPDLVSICWILLESQQDGPPVEIKRRYTVIKPQGWTVSAESTKIHGITHAQAVETGADLRTVLAEFKADLQQVRWVIAHNMAFDSNVMINAYYWRLRDDPTRFWDKKKEFCSMLQSADELNIIGANGKPKWPKLDELYAKTFSKSAPVNAHNAERDVDVLCDVVRSRWLDALMLE